jgi:predicted nucleotidyltransferase component of viral defense system
MQKVLMAIADDNFLVSNIYFKGGTCAVMLGYLDRFSVDLDFDIKKDADRDMIDEHINKIFNNLDLKIDIKQKEKLFYTVKYKSKENFRSTLKLSISDDVCKSSVYKPYKFDLIDRTLMCQDLSTMFANKLVAPIDRFKIKKIIAARDIFDIHEFFISDYPINYAVIKERTGLEFKEYIKKLIAFIDKNVTEKIIDQDLNYLLDYDKFKKIRKTLKQDTLLYLRNLV